ncbi:hypothetical protein ACROYT_G006025 [Oculina patagonica]
MNARAGDKARKAFSKVIGDLGLKITVQSNLKVVDYLDVTLNLTTGRYYPYRKPDNDPLYINAKCNHPPSTIRQIPTSIGTRISGLSCDQDEFHKTSQLYNNALKSSGFNQQIHYVKNQDQGRTKSRNRPRNIIWFNPPYSQNVRTNIAKSFLCLIDKHFPKSNKLHKIFNRNNLKVSYSCTTNMANIIKSHNQKILNESNAASSEKKCNCRNKNLCPLDGTCLTKNIIYEATVTTTSGNSRTYIGMTEHEFKTRYNNHKLSFKDRKHSHDTVLSKHIWDLKDRNVDYKINWRIIKRARAYKGNPSRCNLCLCEKLCILTSQNASLLNKKSELNLMIIRVPEEKACYLSEISTKNIPIPEDLLKLLKLLTGTAVKITPQSEVKLEVFGILKDLSGLSKEMVDLCAGLSVYRVTKGDEDLKQTNDAMEDSDRAQVHAKRKKNT